MMGRIHRPSGQGARLPELTLRQKPYPLGLALRCLALLYQAAQDSAQGDFRWSRVSGGYFYKWAYQIPYILYEAAVLWKKNRSGCMEDLLMLVILCGIFCVYLLVEVQVRYRYIIVPFLCLLDGMAMGRLFRRRKKETK